MSRERLHPDGCPIFKGTDKLAQEKGLGTIGRSCPFIQPCNSEGDCIQVEPPIGSTGRIEKYEARLEKRGQFPLPRPR